MWNFVDFLVKMLIDLGPVWECSPPRFLAPLYIFQLNRSISTNSAPDGVERAPKKVLQKLQVFCGAAPW
jgi:hypothetical protein